jgi:hypothetical protein
MSQAWILMDEAHHRPNAGVLNYATSKTIPFNR